MRVTGARNGGFARPLLALRTQCRKLKPGCERVAVPFGVGPARLLKFSIGINHCHGKLKRKWSSLFCAQMGIYSGNMKLSSKSIYQIHLIFYIPVISHWTLRGTIHLQYTKQQKKKSSSITPTKYSQTFMKKIWNTFDIKWKKNKSVGI